MWRSLLLIVVALQVHLSGPGSQLVQGLSALAQGQLRWEQMAEEEQGQQGSSLAGLATLRFFALFPPAAVMAVQLGGAVEEVRLVDWVVAAA